ncbi:MAG TPA: molybdenum ABC transporter ATP-binding protein [Terriglobales bacterium]|nr:molybdenum ABC transporter ATP-binding protein [Terriglobales bacterium]
MAVQVKSVTMATSTNITAAGLSVAMQKRFGVREAFSIDMNFNLGPGFTVLFGASGAGKTTVLDCIAGLTAPEAGRISINGDVLFDSKTRVNVAVERRRVGYVLQTLALFPHLRVQQNIEYGIASLDAIERRKRVEAVLESFRITHVVNRRPGEISGGEKQRVALARTLVTAPRVLLLDEPLSALDAPTKSRILDDLRAWNDLHRIPVVYVTHSREEVFALAEHAIAIERGRVVAEGNPFDVLQAPVTETTAYLAGFENIFDARIAGVHEDGGTMTCVAGAVSFETPLARMHEGELARIGIRAGDVLVAAVRPQGLSARNVIPGRIAGITKRDRTVVLQVDCGVLFETHVTPQAQESLELVLGREVWLVFKTHSCHILRRDMAAE